MLAAVQGGVVGTQLKSRVGKKIEEVFQITGQMKFQWFPRKNEAQVCLVLVDVLWENKARNF